MTDKHETQPPLCILHLEDSLLDHTLLKRELNKQGVPLEIHRVDTLDAFSQALGQHTFDLIIADYKLAGFTALEAWKLLQLTKQSIPFVLLSGAIGETAAVEAIRAGISDYLPKADLTRIRHVVQRAIEMHKVIVSKTRADQELLHSQTQLALLAEHLQDTIEQERASIAREIHDDIGGSLAAIRFDLSWVARHTADADTLAHVAAATTMLQHAIDASQRIMRNLRPAILDQGLAAALQWLASDFCARTRIDVVLRPLQPLNSVSKTIQLVAYRTAQEALTNIVKHAQCSRVKIDVASDEQFLTLEVSDNGKGASDQDLSKSQSFGLRGLQERAKTVGGWLDVSSRPGCGLSITLSVPLIEPPSNPHEPAQDDQSNFV